MMDAFSVAMVGGAAVSLVSISERGAQPVQFAQGRPRAEERGTQRGART
jgi:hypothetical protein